jgi:hypothetical protein
MTFDNLETLAYRSLIVSDRHEPISLRELERAIGYSMPSDFVEFLNKYPNTGIFEAEGVVFIASDDRLSGNHDGRYAIDMLYAACSKKSCDLLALRQKNAGYDPIPADYLRIGEDSFGNVFCLSLLEATFGKVYFWDHEHPGDETGFHFVAPDFATFVDSLEIVLDD